MPSKQIAELDSFLNGFKKKAIQEITGFNGNTWKSKTWEHKEPSSSPSEQASYLYQHEVNVSRGEVFGKATVSEILIRGRASKTFIERGLAKEGDSVDARVLQIEIFPQSPILPMGHINMERFCANKNLLTANLDIFPASTSENEIDIIRRKMAGVAEKHGKNQAEISAGLAEQYNMEG